MVGNHPGDLGVKERGTGSGKFDQFLETRTSALFIATREN
jgi:hypothetical protein